MDRTSLEPMRQYLIRNFDGPEELMHTIRTLPPDWVGCLELIHELMAMLTVHWLRKHDNGCGAYVLVMELSLLCTEHLDDSNHSNITRAAISIVLLTGEWNQHYFSLIGPYAYKQLLKEDAHAHQSN